MLGEHGEQSEDDRGQAEWIKAGGSHGDRDTAGTCSAARHRGTDTIRAAEQATDQGRLPTGRSTATGRRRNVLHQKPTTHCVIASRSQAQDTEHQRWWLHSEPTNQSPTVTRPTAHCRLTRWRPLLPYGYSYKASCACQTGLSSHL